MELSNEKLKEEVIEMIKTIFDPEIPVNIYDLGLIYEINVLPEQVVEVVMTLTSVSYTHLDVYKRQVLYMFLMKV